MNQEQFEKAKKIAEKKRAIRRELEIWRDNLTSPYYLGYLQNWNNNHATKLETNMNKELFMAFRQSVINDLECQIMRLDAEFSEI